MTYYDMCCLIGFIGREWVVKEFVGLNDLADNNEIIDWDDFREIVYCFADLTKDKDFTIIACKGLGTDFLKTFEDNPEWTPCDCQRYVGKILAEALNGMLREGAHGEDIFKSDAELRNVGRECTGQHVLESGDANRLPDNVKVSLGHDRYVNIILGRLKGPQREGPIVIRAHRLACWLMHGNAKLGTSAKNIVVTHACVKRPGCVRLACLQWESQKKNIEDSYAPKRRRKSC